MTGLAHPALALRGRQILPLPHQFRALLWWQLLEALERGVQLRALRR